jgi:hypothetical protein
VWTLTSTVRAGGNQVLDKSKLFNSDVGAVMLFVSGNDFLECS